MTQTESQIFNRVERLVGLEGLEALQNLKVIVFGVGGVGGWCAESLVRSGVKHLTIVDSDRVSITNVNRQAMATTLTVGQVKVEALKQRLLAINPDARIDAREGIYSADTADLYPLCDYDYVIDAIDSLQDKVTLILRATAADCKFYSSMGAALKMDPTKISVAEFYKVQGCPLARALRRRMKSLERYPARKFKCVYSPEVLQNKGADTLPPPGATASYADSRKAQINGTLAHTTAIFGFTLAGLVVQDALGTH